MQVQQMQPPMSPPQAQCHGSCSSFSNMKHLKLRSIQLLQLHLSLCIKRQQQGSSSNSSSNPAAAMGRHHLLLPHQLLLPCIPRSQ
jgi:hypothetical protein